MCGQTYRSNVKIGHDYVCQDLYFAMDRWILKSFAQMLTLMRQNFAQKIHIYILKIVVRLRGQMSKLVRILFPGPVFATNGWIFKYLATNASLDENKCHAEESN